jgi:hypothetical protein
MRSEPLLRVEILIEQEKGEMLPNLFLRTFACKDGALKVEDTFVEASAYKNTLTTRQSENRTGGHHNFLRLSGCSSWSEAFSPRCLHFSTSKTLERAWHGGNQRIFVPTTGLYRSSHHTRK